MNWMLNNGIEMFFFLQFFRPMPNNNNNNKQNVPQRTGKNQNTLKFENEFDFEQANSKFEELRSQLAKLKVGSEETKNTEQVIFYYLSSIWPLNCFVYCMKS
jgi:FDF domain